MSTTPPPAGDPQPSAPTGSAAGSAEAPAGVHIPDDDFFAAEDEGMQKGLSPRQLQMIAIGSAIGTGLFLGAGGGLAASGPALAIVYAVCGFMGYLMLRSLGELVVHRPSSGSFVSYTRQFYGERSAFTAGWLYWLNWATTAVADATAIALYIAWFGRYSEFVAAIPQGLTALVVLAIVLAMNLVSVKVFGELEFWFAFIKVAALVTFLVVGILFLIFGTPTGSDTGFHLISENGGWFPFGAVPALLAIQGTVFAYAGIELVGTTSGETQDAKTVIPKAVNTVLLRIALFYVGSIVLLVLLLPASAYSGSESPFVTFFDSIGITWTAPVMQLVVITAAASSLNAGLYSTGRIVHSMAMAGSAPEWAGRLNKHGVPVGGIWLTSIVGVLGVGLNFIVPEDAFTIVLNIAAFGTMAAWAAICLSHMKFVHLAKKGVYSRPKYRAPLAPVNDIVVLAFLAIVVVMMAFDYPVGTYTLAFLLLLVPVLIGGWFLVRKRVMAIAAERQGYTGEHPVLAASQYVEERGRGSHRYDG
ncbi:amino acid permease [Helcobacillus massiliensis]|uniref:L-asparagine permease n=1 Tax=Helcobacillus massiliensis TaxID=521392 RepID=A0A839QNJ0_9MICO|nr:L-asparagine permease [Helcobacillus massiliensis]